MAKNSAFNTLPAQLVHKALMNTFIELFYQKPVSNDLFKGRATV